MKFKNTFIILLLIFILLISFSSVVAAANDNINNTLTNELSLDQIEKSNENQNLSSGKVYYVDSDDAHDSSNPNNQMSNRSIQKVINEASAGDTIIINGEFYNHCHFVIDKKLTIKSNVNTRMDTCPSNTEGSGYKGIFYISSEASGTVIDGFTIINGASSQNDYGILVKGASNVIIRNCVVTTSVADSIRVENAVNAMVENVSLCGNNNALRIQNSQNTTVKKSIFNNSNIGINIISSTKTSITENNITKNQLTGIYVDTQSSYITIQSNNISYNKLSGINLQSTNYVYIISNYIVHNHNGDSQSFTEGYGVYINNDIVKIEIKGNFFERNGMYGVFNDENVSNINLNYGAYELEIIDNNYFMNHKTRVVFHKQVGSVNPDTIYLGYAFLIQENLCPTVYFESSENLWNRNTDKYMLKLSSITQVKKGIYQISIINSNGKVAEDISSVYVTFYLNKNNAASTPQEGDIYKTVLMKNGVATVKFTMDEFEESGNVVLATFPGIYSNWNSNPYQTLEIDDNQIPGIPSNTTITISDITTYPNSGVYATATLTDQYGNKVVGEPISFTLNSKTTNISTDSNGQAKLKISQSSVGNFILTVNYAGDEVDYLESSAKATIVVKKDNSKIISSNLNMIPKRAEVYSIALKDANGNPISNQKITIQVNGKTYSKKTNSKGIVSIKLKFNKNKKTYKVSIKFAGNNKYKAASKTNTIKVKYSSKTTKLTAPKVIIPPYTKKTYTISLKDSNGKALAKQKVKISLNGKKYTKKTNAKGQIKFNIKYSKLKTYKVKASYAGNKIYKKATTTGYIKVTKTQTKFKASKITIAPTDTKTYGVTLLTSANKVLAKQKIAININGKTYTKTTNSKGQVSVDVKFDGEGTYAVQLKYAGNKIYKATSATSSITVSKIETSLISYNKTFSKDSNQNFSVILKDISGNLLSNQEIIFTYNNQSIYKNTDANGVSSINVSNILGSFDVFVNYAGSSKYKSISKTNTITVLNTTNIVYIDDNLANEDIQNILNSCDDGNNVEFLSKSLADISLDINKALNIYSNESIVLNAKKNQPIFKIKSSNVNISNIVFKANNSNAIEIVNASNVNIFNNTILNSLDESILSDYLESTISLPGYGISISNASFVEISNNHIETFESGIFSQFTNNLIIKNNFLIENNYGVKYGWGVANTEIYENVIYNSTGLYDLTVPEGPRGYGIFLNNSAVNVTITRNNITWNHLGISIDANYSTGINITSNLISDNVLEGIRFNAGYDLAENAVESIVIDNAIYRNARGPSMMILGELSANPNGIYGPGEFDNELRLKLDANWYGANSIKMWNNEEGVVGVGTMCPRINTTAIYFNETECVSPGNYSITFYRDGQKAVNLAEFDLYATINRGTEYELEINFHVINGVATFSFSQNNFNSTGNKIEISAGSLKDEDRDFIVFYTYYIPDSEIPV